jgi:hypothetical protein
MLPLDYQHRMSSSVSPHDGLRLAQELQQKYAGSIHDFMRLGSNCVLEMHELAHKLDVHSLYKINSQVRFLWELLELGDDASRVKEVVQHWVKASTSF